MLAACIGGALAIFEPILQADDVAPGTSGFTYVVTSCDDSGPGTLRDALAALPTGGLVDMTQLTCSAITLTSGELSTPANYLIVNGGGTMITSAHASRVLAHRGTERIRLDSLDIRDGEIAGTPNALGGCIYSTADVVLSNVTISGCLATSTNSNNASLAEGGGVFARGTVYLDGSVVSDNAVIPANVSYNYGHGGGIFADALYADRSTITGNSAMGNSVYTTGGGFFVQHQALIEYSTIDNNSAYEGGGGQTGHNGASLIRSSTISSNSGGGLLSSDALLDIRNSTITANTFPTTRVYGHGSGLWLLGQSPYLALRSSIVAGNTAGEIADDIDVNDWYNPIIGSNNVVIASNIPPPSDTIRDDPQLLPLSENGGPTRTHALAPGSPAIDRGRNPDRDAYDQRGEGYARIVGVATDIGSYELQVAQPPPNPIFASGFE